MILGNLKYLSIQQIEFSNICLGKYIIQFYPSISKSGRVAKWSKATSRNHSQNLCVFDSHYGNFSTQLYVVNCTANVHKCCYYYQQILLLAHCSHYICQLYVNNGSQKYSLLDVLEMVYMYQLYLTIRCHIYNWTTADTEPRLKSVNLTTKTFAVHLFLKIQKSKFH